MCVCVCVQVPVFIGGGGGKEGGAEGSAQSTCSRDQPGSSFIKHSSLAFYFSILNFNQRSVY